jgi:hypothetical protein
MQVGKLKNEKFLESHKTHGFSNKTKMLDHALDLLKEQVKKAERRQAREQMFNDYAASSVENHFISIDGDDFE